jgi:phosphoglycerate kinase
MAVRYVDELNLKGKKVLIRCDFNVPLDDNQNITDDTRIRETLPTLRHILKEGARLIVVSHLGRPKGKVDKKLSLAPVAKRLSELLGKDVLFVESSTGGERQAQAAGLKPGQLLMLENLRFRAEEEKNDEAFARELAQLADVYVNDAFSVSHRAHASVEAIAHFVTERGAGFLMKKEITSFQKAMDSPKRPLVAVIGGAKVSDKLKLLGTLLQKVDKLLVGGGMAFTFLKAQGFEVGKSIVEEDLLEAAKEIIDSAKARGAKLYLPVDCVVAQSKDVSAQTRSVPIQEIPPDWIGLDVGQATSLLFREALNGAGTIVWNGPMGVFELEPFKEGTMEMARTIATSGAFSVVGGGDTGAAVRSAGKEGEVGFISTAGGAFLELLEGRKLPGIEALEQG